MNKKLLIAVISIVVVIAVVTVTLVLVLRDKPDSDPDPVLTSEEVFDLIIASLRNKGEITDSSVTSIKADIDIVIDDKAYLLRFQGNLDSEDVSNTGFLIQLIDKGQLEVVFGIYYIPSGLYLSFGPNNPKLHLVDFDTQAIAGLLIGSGGGSDVGLPTGGPIPVDMVLGMVMDMLLPEEYTMTEKNGKTEIEMELKINDVFDTLVELVDAFDLEEMLTGLLPGVEFDFDAVLGLFDSVPEMEVILKAVIENNKNTSLKIDATVKDSDVETLKFDIKFDISDELISLGLPNDIANYTPFSFTDIAFEVAIDIDADSVDMAAVINLLLGSDLVPEGFFILDTTEVLNMVVKADLSLESNLQNRVLFELYRNNDKIMSAYFLNGNLYIAVEDIMPGMTDLSSIKLKVPNVDITGSINGVIDSIGSMLSGDVAAYAGSDIISLSSNGSGFNVLPTVNAIAAFIAKVVGLDNNYVGDNNGLVITIDSAILSLVQTLLPEGTPDIAAWGVLLLSYSNSDKELNLALDMGSFTANMLIDNITVGKEIANLNADILEGIGDEADYVNTSEVNIIEHTLLTLLKSGEINASISLQNAPNTIINFTDMLSGLLAEAGQMLSIPITLELYKANTELELNVRWNLDYDDPSNSEAIIELIGDSGRVILGVYSLGNTLYVDLSSLGLFRVKFDNANLSKTIMDKAAAIWEGIDGVDDDEEQGEPSEGEEPSSPLDVKLSTILFQDDLLYLAFTTEFVSSILDLIGLGLPIGFPVDGEMDIFNGYLSVQGQLFDAIDMSIGVEINGLGTPQVIDFSGKNLASFMNTDALDALSLFDSFMNDLNLNFWLDLNMRNITAATQTRITISKVGPSGFSFGDTYWNPNTLLFTIYGNMSVTANQRWVFAGLDFEAGQVKAQGTSNWWSYLFGLASGEMFAVPVDADVKGLFLGMFGNISNLFNPVEEVEETVIDCFDDGTDAGLPKTLHPYKLPARPMVNSAEKITGVSVKILPFDQIRVNMSFNAEAFNNFMFNMFDDAFRKLIMLDENGNVMGNPSAIVYNNTTANSFANSFIDNFIWPMVQANAGSLASLLGLIKSTMVTGFRNLIQKFLPLPDFTSLTAEINILQGQFANAIIHGDTAGNQYMNATLYNNLAGTFTDTGLVDWGNQASVVVYDPLNNKSLASYFNTTAIYHKGETRVNPYYAANASARTTTNNITWNYNSVVNTNVPGDYLVTGTAFAAQGGYSIQVLVTVLEAKDIESVEPVNTNVYSAMPTSVVVNFDDGTSRVVNNVVINATATDFTEQSVTGSVNLGGTAYDVEVNYADRTIVGIEGAFQTDAYSLMMFGTQTISNRAIVEFADGSKMPMYVNGWTLDDDENENKIAERTVAATATVGTGAYAQTVDTEVFIIGRENPTLDLANTKVVDGVSIFEVHPYNYMVNGAQLFGDVVAFNYGDKTINHTVTWGELPNIADVKFEGNEPFDTTVTFTAYGYTQVIDVVVIFMDKVAVEVTNMPEGIFDNLNPYNYLNEQQRAAIYPSRLTIKFADNTYCSMLVTWDRSNEEFTPYGGSFTVNPVIGTGLLAQNLPSVEVTFVEKIVDEVTSLPEGIFTNLNPYSFVTAGQRNALYPSTVTVKFTDGTSMTLPATWDRTAEEFTPEGGSFDVYPIIGSGSIAQYCPVEVVTYVEKTIDKIVLTNDEYVIDPYNVSYASTFNVLFTDETTMSLPGYWIDMDSFDITFGGGTYTTTIQIASNDLAQNTDITVVVLDRTIVSVALATPVLDPYNVVLPATVSAQFIDGTSRVFTVEWIYDFPFFGGNFTLQTPFRLAGLEQIIPINVVVLNRTITSVPIVTIDPYNVNYPTQLTAGFADSSTRVFSVEWLNIVVYNNHYSGSNTFKSVKLTASGYDQFVAVNVVVTNRTITEALTSFVFDYYNYIAQGEAMLGNTINVNLADGTNVTFDVEWDFSNFMVAAGNYVVPATIYRGDAFREQTVGIDVEIFKRDIDDSVPFVLSGLSPYDIVLPTTFTFPVVGGGTITLPVTIDTLGQDLEEPTGGTYLSTITCNQGTFDLTIIVEDKTITSLESITLYAAQGGTINTALLPSEVTGLLGSGSSLTLELDASMFDLSGINLNVLGTYTMPYTDVVGGQAENPICTSFAVTVKVVFVDRPMSLISRHLNNQTATFNAMIQKDIQVTTAEGDRFVVADSINYDFTGVNWNSSAQTSTATYNRTLTLNGFINNPFGYTLKVEQWRASSIGAWWTFAYQSTTGNVTNVDVALGATIVEINAQLPTLVVNSNRTITPQWDLSNVDVTTAGVYTITAIWISGGQNVANKTTRDYTLTVLAE